MRHRITSFRCVEAMKKMSLSWVSRKTCIAVNNRQTSSLRAIEPLGSGAAILDHPSDLRPRRHDERGKPRRSERNSPAAGGDRVEQRIVGAKLRNHVRRGCVE